MRHYELTYRNVNSESYAKPITLLVIAPDTIGLRTGAMLFSHGWGGNRYQYQATMEYAAQAFDLVCIAAEFRQSGYDFNPVTGAGAYRPYDASFYQVFDILNGLRTVLEIHPELNRRRLFTYGGSQGGHLALLTTIYAPHTFALVYAASPVVHLNSEPQRSWPGRYLAPWELSIRDLLAHAEAIQCPVILEHGTADQTVACDEHTRALEIRLQALGNKVQATYYQGGGHGLEPVTNRLETFKQTAPPYLETLETDGRDDFLEGRSIEIPCGEKRLCIDWSRPCDSVELFAWR